MQTNDLNEFYSPTVYYFYEKKLNDNFKHYLLRGDCHGRLAIWNLNEHLTGSRFKDKKKKIIFLILFLFSYVALNSY